MNPFTTTGYRGPEYFCDREAETEKLHRLLVNGNNVVLLAHRRIGKTGLIRHCVETNNLRNKYNVFIIDIFRTKDLQEFTLALANAVVSDLRKFDEKALNVFLSIVTSLQGLLSSSVPGQPEMRLQYAGKPRPEFTLEQIFKYIGQSRRPCIIAIDEFQQIAKYPEKNTEAILRTFTQQTPESRYIFAGSERRIMNRMFTDSSRPFYQSATPIHLNAIDPDKYLEFAKEHFIKAEKELPDEIFSEIYGRFDGITWYVQKLLNEIYSIMKPKQKCDSVIFRKAFDDIIESYNYLYEETMYNLPQKQKELLIAFSKNGVTKEPQSETFLSKYGLTASSVQSARRGLLQKELITEELGTITLYDKFLDIWINRNY